MKKSDIVRKIPKDKKAILNLWNKVELSYEHTKKLKGKERIYSNDMMRKAMNKIPDHALESYGYKPLISEIANTFDEFWSFLHWWLKDVGIDGDKWNEQEDFFHKNKKQ